MMYPIQKRTGPWVLWVSLVLGLSLALIPTAVLAAGGKGRGAYSCGAFIQNDVANYNIILVMDEETDSAGTIYINRDLVIQGGWRPFNTANNCGDNNGGVFPNPEEAYDYFDFDPQVISPLPAPDSGPVLSLGPRPNNISALLFGNLRIENIRFHDNTNTAPAITGKVANQATGYLENLIFENNQAGGFYLKVKGHSRLFISNVQFIGNSAEKGGAFTVEVFDTSEVMIDNIQVLSNTAQGNAGGGRLIVHDSGRVVIKNSVFLANQAGGNGGALLITGSPNAQVQIINTVFARNTSGGPGAGIYVGEGQVDIFHSTFANPGRYLKQAIQLGGGTVQVKNSIIAGFEVGLRQRAGSLTEDYNLYFNNGLHRSGTMFSGGHSLDEAQPRFSGVPTDNYRIGPTSEALDMGTDLGITDDFEANNRPVGSGPDIGADERAFTKLGPGAVTAGQPLTYSLILDRTDPEVRDYVFNRPGSINLPGASLFGPATPYPSLITVSQALGAIQEVKVTLNNFNMFDNDEVDILLVGPTGQAVSLLSDLTYDEELAQVLRLADDATEALPDSSSDDLIDRAYRPADYEESTDDSFSNNELNPLTIPSIGNADPYPSSASVSFNNMGVVKGLEVNLRNVDHTNPDDLDVLLVGPTGQKVMLMSDAGGAANLVNTDLTFNNTAAPIPNNNALTSGAYRPADYLPGENLPAPAPGGPYSTDLAVFNGTNPNGDWHLYIADDSASNSGVISSWALNITVDDDFFPPLAPAEPYSTTLSAFNGLSPNGAWKLFVVDDEGGSSNGGSIGGWKLHLQTFVKEQIMISDALPAGMTYRGFEGDGWSCNLASDMVNCSRFDSVTVNPVPLLQLKMEAPATFGVITNTAVIFSNLPGLAVQNTIATTLVNAGDKTVYLPLLTKRD